MKKLAILAVMVLLSANVIAAVTIDNLQYTHVGDKTMVLGQLDFDSTYDTGGEILNPSSVGLAVIDFFQLAGDPYGHSTSYNPVTKKLKVYGKGADFVVLTANDRYGEVSSGEDLSNILNVPFTAIGN